MLGSNKEETIQRAVQASGVSENKVNNILSAIAPMLMSLLGKQTEEDDDKESGASGLVGALLDNVDVGSLLSGFVGGNDNSPKPAFAQKSNAGGIVGGILSGLLKK